MSPLRGGLDVVGTLEVAATRDVLAVELAEGVDDVEIKLNLAQPMNLLDGTLD